MPKKKAKKLDITKLKQNQIVWSVRFQAYLRFIGVEEESEFLFQAITGRQLYLIYKSDIYEPHSLIKELL